MALNSTALQSTASVSWIARLRSAPLRLTPIGRYYRVNHSKPIFAPSVPHILELSIIFLFRDLRRIHQYFGLLVAKLRLTVKDSRRQLQLTRWRWSFKLKAFRWFLLNTARRMYWRTTLPLSHRLERLRMWMNYRRVKARVKKLFPPSPRSTTRRKSGEFNGPT